MLSSGIANTLRFRIVIAMLSVAIVASMLTIWLSSRTVASRFEAYQEAVAAQEVLSAEGVEPEPVDDGVFGDAATLTPEENFLTSVNRNYLYGVLLAIFVTFLISIGVVQGMVAPLERLLGATRLLALGEYNAKIEVESEDEIRELNDLINHMADKLANAEAARRRLVDDIVTDLRAVIDDAAATDRYLADLTLLNQAEARELTPQLRAVPLPELVALNEERVAPQAAASGVILKVDLPSRLPAVRADWEMTSQVIAILLENALMFAPKESTVTISAKRSRSEVTLQIEDDGPLLGLGDLDKIFAPYYRSEMRNGPAGHTGAQLALAAQFILTMEGRIWARSPRSGGTLFAFALPFAE